MLLASVCTYATIPKSHELAPIMPPPPPKERVDMDPVGVSVLSALHIIKDSLFSWYRKSLDFNQNLHRYLLYLGQPKGMIRLS